MRQRRLEGTSPRTLLFCSFAECSSPAAAASRRRRQRPSDFFGSPGQARLRAGLAYFFARFFSIAIVLVGAQILNARFNGIEFGGRIVLVGAKLRLYDLLASRSVAAKSSLTRRTLLASRSVVE